MQVGLEAPRRRGSQKQPRRIDPMPLRAAIALLQTAVLVLLCGGTMAASQQVSWRNLQPGAELAIVSPQGKSSGPLYVVRVDARRAKVRVALASEEQVPPRTAAEWCRKARLAVAINAGMFQTDHRSNVGYLRHGKHLNNRRWNSYRSVVAVNPRDKSLPAVLWLDRETSKTDPRLAEYDVVVQNLRLIAKDRRNVWSPSVKRWSEAALALDSQGRLLFLFSRAPYSMRDWNAMLLGLPLDVVAAMHLEGGPEASLSIHAPGIDLDLAGSFETGFLPDDSNDRQWAIPNVLGVMREDAAAGNTSGNR
jgi:phosphodiester glycosidase